MDAIELLKTRASNGKLTEPAPDADTLRFAFEAVTRTPDHGSLRPFRIRVVRGSARENLGTLMADSLRRNNPQASADELSKAKSKALRAPMILVVGAVLKPHPKVPEIEQILAAGAAAHTLLLALQARGYAAIWRTGGPAYDATLKQALGFSATDALVGFIYTGTAKQPAPELVRPQPSEFVSEWSGSS
jgi:nitroreductase